MGTVLNTAVSDTVERMMLALPDLTFGDRIHDIYVNRLQGALPGTDFRMIFYPSWQPAQLADEVSGATGLYDDWWADFSVAVLCQSMWYLTSSLKPQLLQGDIDGAVNACNAALRTRSGRVYALALARFFGPFKQEYDAVRDRAATLAEYRRGLLENVGMHRIWYAAGEWKNPDWELFNHIAKMLALGASEGDIDSLIGELDAAGLPIPPTVTVQTWRSYTAYMSRNVDHADTDGPARGGILKTTYYSGMPIFTPSGMPTGSRGMPEGNSFKFTARTQPGNRYRRAPGGGSCFSGNARVLMEGGSALAIREVRAGARVATPRGTREVAFVSTPLRAGRPLHALNGMDFGFTATHPFANGNAGAAFLCVDPVEARRLIPTFGHVGVGVLAEGTRVLQPVGADGAAAEPVRVVSVAPYDAPDADDPHVYDLVLHPDEEGIPLYWVGDGSRFVLTAPELPVLTAAPHAAGVLMAAMERGMPALTEALAGTGLRVEAKPPAAVNAVTSADVGRGVDPQAAADAGGMFERLTLFGAAGLAGAVGGAAERAGGAGDRGGNPAEREGRALLSGAALSNRPEDAPATTPWEQVGGFLASLGALEGVENVVFGAAFETLSSRLVDEAEMAVALGWREFTGGAGEVVALSVGGLLLDAGHAHPAGALRGVVEVVVGDMVRETHALPGGLGRESTAFAHYFDQVVYLRTPAGTAGGARLDFTFYSPGARIPLFAASAYLPDVLDPYRRFQPPVEAGDRTVHGELHLDLRCITAQAAARERELAPRWDSAARAAYAGMLGQTLGEVVAERTAPARY